jgi:endoglucanase
MDFLAPDHRSTAVAARPSPAKGLARRTFLNLSATALSLLHFAAEPATPKRAAGCTAAPADWPLWSSFIERFGQDDGRVVDYSVPQLHSTSEGQSYGMFFALVANQPERFERMWRWSVANLAGGNVARRLPAWQWGQRKDGNWGVIDNNPASDADLWFAYALLEAARLWKRPDYEADARTLLARITQDEVVDLPGLGKMLLPGPVGFSFPDQKLWRLNASYLPLPLLRRFAQADPKGPWHAIANNTIHLLNDASPRGYAPDWIAWRATDVNRGGWVVDPQTGDTGSYDAIRTYLWAGMLNATDPAAAPLRRALGGMATAVELAETAPEKVQTTTGVVQGTGPIGFVAALLPFFQAEGRAAPLLLQQKRVEARLTDPNSKPPYYDHVLSLFAMGWLDKRYQFLPTGKLHLRWEKACPTANTR